MGGSGGSGSYTGGGGSGAGGGGGGVGGGGGASGANPCILILDTNLFGPVPGVADQLASGDPLEIRLAGTAPAQVGVFASSQGSAQVGSIAGLRQLPTLIECLANGVAYTGTVIAVNGPDIQIRIENA